MSQNKTLAQRLAESKARARKAAHQNAIADRKHVSEVNRKIRKSNKANG
jgi:hypothetical protein